MTKAKMTAAEAAIELVSAFALAIRAAGSIPSGHLYAQVTGKVSLEEYQLIITTLKRANLVKESNYLLTWVGPTSASEQTAPQ